MTCAWDSLIQILPTWLRLQLRGENPESLQEIRLRLQFPAELVTSNGVRWLDKPVTGGDIGFCIQAASRYSPWAAETMSQGYLTAPGGHRIGICGVAIYKNGVFSGLREISSLCIRVAKDYVGFSTGTPRTGSILILGAPGWGKTTLLRDLSRVRAETETVAVVDERGELFPEGILRGKRMDVLVGAKKGEGIERVLKTMTPDCIAVDEITSEEDCLALCHAWGCGVRLMATAHAGSMDEFYHRPIYQQLVRMQIFDSCLVLYKDKSFKLERMGGS